MKRELLGTGFVWLLLACSLVMGGISTCLAEKDSRCLRTDSQSQQEQLARIDNIICRGPLLRRQLIGPGSYPPRCTGKCGHCVPCRAVHVTVPPGAHIVAEYYPEMWRCRCGSHLYIP